jgi:hypothetical protein
MKKSSLTKPITVLLAFVLSILVYSPYVFAAEEKFDPVSWDLL